MQLKLDYNRCGATSERQRTAVPVVYGIECSVMMNLKWTAEVTHFTLLFIFCAGCCHPRSLRGKHALWRYSQLHALAVSSTLGMC